MPMSAETAAAGVDGRRLIEEIALDYGFDFFKQHASGIAIKQTGLEALVAAVDMLRAYPEWTVLIEGHCPGRPEENNDIRESIGEEAADICKLHFENAGVKNAMVCTGIGSAQGRGLLVRVSVVRPELPNDVLDHNSALVLDAVEPELSVQVEVEPDSAVVDEGAKNIAAEEEAKRKAAEEEAKKKAADEDKARIKKDEDEAEAMLALMPETPAVPLMPETPAAPTLAPETPAIPAEVTPLMPETLATPADVIPQFLVESPRGVELTRAESVEELKRAETSMLNLDKRISEVEENSKRLQLEAPTDPSAPVNSSEALQPPLQRAETEGIALLQRAETEGIALLQVDENSKRLEPEPATDPASAIDAAQASPEPQQHTEVDESSRRVERDPVDDADVQQPPVPRAESDAINKVTPNTADDDDDDFAVPDTSGMSQEERSDLMKQLLSEVQANNSICFEPNKAEIHRDGKRAVRRLAKVLKECPDFVVSCVGHCKGRPRENNHAKRLLSQQRAASTCKALKELGVTNELYATGYGSSLGKGLSVRLHALNPEDIQDGQPKICGLSEMTEEEQEASLNQLLKEALEEGLSFEPNKAIVRPEAEPVIRQVTRVLKAFPQWIIRCEGHTKGKPSDNNAAKVQLSQVRAEALRAVLETRGVQNSILCVGKGCAQGLGMCVQMVGVEVEKEVIMPDLRDLPPAEQEARINEMLAKCLERNIDFEPNKWDVPASAAAVIRGLTRVLRAYPDVAIRCEGHAKGRPEEDSEAKQRLSQARAEAVRVAVLAEEGVTNVIYAVGEGSRYGLGMKVRMSVTKPIKEFEPDIPDMSSMSPEEQAQTINDLLARVLERKIDFEPNASEIPSSAMGIIRNLTKIFNAVPTLAFRCEGHAKGTPEDNNAAKEKLSNMRAEAVKAAVIAEGVTNTIHCVGEGSKQGLGMAVRICVLDPEELKKFEVAIPETDALSYEERGKALNELLAKALQKAISFEPNRADIQPIAMGTVTTIARVLRSFPEYPVHCEGHTKGKPAENSDVRMRLSQVRAEAVRTALEKEGVTNKIVCAGHGSAQGLGMCVRMFTALSVQQSDAVPGNST